MAAIVSAALGAAVIVAWVAAHGASDRCWVEHVTTPDPATLVESEAILFSENGVLTGGWVRSETGLIPGTRQPPSVRLGPVPTDGWHAAHDRTVISSTDDAAWWSARFAWDAPRQPFQGFAYRDQHALLSAPHWAAVLVLLVPPLTWITNRYRRRDPTRCRHCGYDLRASPERCPECGAASAVERPI